MSNIYDENEVLRDALSGLNDEVPPMPEGLHAAWMQQVEEEAMQKKKQPTRTRFMQNMTRTLSIAAALVFVVGGTLLFKDDLSMIGQVDHSNKTDNSAALDGGSLLTTAVANQYAEDAEADYGRLLDANTQYQPAAASEGEYRVALDAYTAAEESAPMMARGRSMQEPAAMEKKIIRTASLTIATQTYEDSLAALKGSCEQSGGWIENSSESLNSYDGLRTARLTLRIPQTALDSYLAGTGSLGRITRRSESATDVTESYQDNAARLATQEALMERLQALITESADLTDLLALESQIAETQYEIDRLRSALNATDRQVTYSTVDATLREERAPSLTDTTVSFLDRLKAAVATGWEAFTGFLGDMAVFLMAALPFIGIVVLVYAGVCIVRFIRKSLQIKSQAPNGLEKK